MFEALSNLQLILLVIAVLTGLYQLALLLSIVIRGGTTTIWWGIACAACVIAIILL